MVVLPVRLQKKNQKPFLLDLAWLSMPSMGGILRTRVQGDAKVRLSPRWCTAVVVICLVTYQIAAPPSANAAEPSCPELDPCNIKLNRLCSALTLSGLTGLQDGGTAAVLVTRRVNATSAPIIQYWTAALGKLAGPHGEVVAATSEPPQVATHLPSQSRLDLVWMDGLPGTPEGRAMAFASAFGALKPGGRLFILDSQAREICGSSRRICSGIQPIKIEGSQRGTILAEARSAGLAFDSDVPRLFDPAVAPTSEFVCIGSSFKDGTHWWREPFLWRFHKLAR